jgi:hypothetical protein
LLRVQARALLEKGFYSQQELLSLISEAVTRSGDAAAVTRSGDAAAVTRSGDGEAANRP